MRQAKSTSGSEKEGSSEARLLNEGDSKAAGRGQREVKWVWVATGNNTDDLFISASCTLQTLDKYCLYLAHGITSFYWVFPLCWVLDQDDLYRTDKEEDAEITQFWWQAIRISGLELSVLKQLFLPSVLIGHMDLFHFMFLTVASVKMHHALTETFSCYRRIRWYCVNH